MANVFDDLTVLDLSTDGRGSAAAAYLETHGARTLRVRIATADADPGVPAGQPASLGLDVSDVDGESLLEDILIWVDVVVDATNGVAGDLLRNWQDMVVLKVPPFGSTGPWADYRTLPYSISAAAGLTDLTGPRDGPPVLMGDEPGLAPQIATLALAAVLDERRRTGARRRLEVSGVEGTLPGLWTAPLEWTVNGRERSRLGARDVDAAPHGVFRCRDGNWLAIACYTDEDWSALKMALGRPDWCELERMQTRASRLDEQRESDHHISHWVNEQTRRPDESPVLVITMLENLEVPRYTSFELAKYFQSFGVPAAVVQGSDALLDDPQLAYRGRYAAGAPVSPLPAFRFAGQAVTALTGSGDPAALVQTMTGLTDARLATLRASGVVR